MTINRTRSKMNEQKKSIKRAFQTLLCLVALTGMASCNVINEDENPCDPSYYIQFVFDMNMDFADAFSKKVTSVDLYVFNAKTGDFVRKYSEAGDILKMDGYRMELTELLPGSYDFVAWCGLEENDGHFTVPASVKKLEEIGCTLTREHDSSGAATSNLNLYPLFHGKISASLPLDNNEHVYNMPLVKDTNNINFSLQETGGNALDPNRFTISLIVDNGSMAYDNSLLQDEDIVYMPYRQASGSAGVDSSGRSRDGENSEDGVRHDIVVAELSTARLIEGHNPQLVIYDNENEELVYSVPLVKWVLMLKSQSYGTMPDQEYLDREDEYNVVLYINGEEPIYVATSIMINSWRLVLNEGVLGS